MTNPENPRRKRTATIGVAAGLLAGGAIGLVATMPSLTSAATDTAGDAVALQTVEDDAVDTPTADERPEPGERLRETLQPLVDDGTIDDAQADAVTAHLVENRPERDGHEGRRGGALRHQGIVAELIGVETDVLREQLAAGSSIADVAQANGVDPQAVIDGLVAHAEEHAQTRLDHGADQERVDERLAQVTERIEDMVFATRG